MQMDTAFQGVGPIAPRTVFASRLVGQSLVSLASHTLPAAAQLFMNNLNISNIVGSRMRHFVLVSIN